MMPSPHESVARYPLPFVVGHHIIIWSTRQKYDQYFFTKGAKAETESFLSKN